MAEQIKVTLVKSMIGRPEKHRKILRCMGLTKIGKNVVLDNTSSNRGMINKIKHLIQAEENTNDA